MRWRSTTATVALVVVAVTSPATVTRVVVAPLEHDFDGGLLAGDEGARLHVSIPATRPRSGKPCLHGGEDAGTYR
jgi:hypothetical protein